MVLLARQVLVPERNKALAQELEHSKVPVLVLVHSTDREHKRYELLCELRASREAWRTSLRRIQR